VGLAQLGLAGSLVAEEVRPMSPQRGIRPDLLLGASDDVARRSVTRPSSQTPSTSWWAPPRFDVLRFWLLGELDATRLAAASCEHARRRRRRGRRLGRRAADAGSGARRLARRIGGSSPTGPGPARRHPACFTGQWTRKCLIW